MLANYHGTPFVFSYWDGKNEQFGRGRPGFTIHFKTEAALKRSLLETSLGFGEAYARGDLVVEGDLVEALTALGEAYLAMEPERLLSRWARRAAARTLPREKADIEHHYGLGDEFYKFYLDKKLQYSCAYFRSTDDSLDLAQEQKIAHTTKKLHLQPGQRLLDIGCGWGHLMFHAAEVYGVECVGITLCDNQARYIRQEAARRRLPVEVRTINYLELDESIKWERVVSVGMMEHVGESRADQFFDKVKSLLAPRGNLPAALHFENERSIRGRSVCGEARVSGLLVLLARRTSQTRRAPGTEHPRYRKPAFPLHPDRAALAGEFLTELRRDQISDEIR